MKNYVIGAVVVVILVGLLVWGRMAGKDVVAYWPNSTVAWLQGGEVNLAQHFHPKLTINVDGQGEVIPANIGINTACLAEIHTHDNTGEIHVEAQSSGIFKLGDFFAVWGKSIEREGYSIALSVDGEDKRLGSDFGFGDLVLKDSQNIVITYTSPTAPVASTTIEVKI